MPAEFPPGPRRPGSVPGLCLWALVLVLLLIYLVPTVSRSHVEGFSYFTETMSMQLPDLAAADPLWPINRDFYYMTRPGVVWIMAPLSGLFPGRGYDILMWIVMPVFLSGLVLTTRRLGGASWLASVAVLLFLPIAIEANFFTNDNLLATGLSLWAIVIVTGARGAVAVAVAGALFSLATLVRLDQLLLAPFLVALMVLHARDGRAVLVGMLAAAAGFAIVHGAVALLDPRAANILLRISLASGADALWDRLPASGIIAVVRDTSAALIAFGAGIPAIVAGARTLARRAERAASGAPRRGEALRFWAMPILLMGYPIFIYALTIGKYYDPRGFMTVLPMIAPLAAVGLQHHVFGPLLGDPNVPARSRLWTSVVAAVLVLPVLVPGVPILQRVLPLPVETENAPPTLTGRVWYHEAWRNWQETNFHAPERRVAALVDGIVASGNRRRC
jgi:hypothetical protein